MTRLTKKIIVITLLRKSINSNATFFNTICKSGNFQVGNSVSKNVLESLNIVWLNNNPANKVIKPLKKVNPTPTNQAYFALTNAFAIQTKTSSLALHDMNGVIIKTIVRSFNEWQFRAIITAGILQPIPVIRVITLFPLKPNLSNCLSTKSETLDRYPVCSIRLIKKNIIMMYGAKPTTVNIPPNNPSATKF